MSRAQISKHYERILAQWPVDRLRPQIAFQNVLKKRIEFAPAAPLPAGSVQNTAQALPPTARTTRSSEMRDVNALYSMLESRYSRQYPVSNQLMTPTSAPDFYKNLGKEIHELPDRTWLGNFKKRMSGMIRWK